jgi:hypothetical protein
VKLAKEYFSDISERQTGLKKEVSIEIIFTNRDK